MNSEEQTLIDGLFSRLQQAETQADPRDAQAEARIREHLNRQPAAGYFMTQAILVQEAAIKRLDEHNKQLAQQLQQAGDNAGDLCWRMPMDDEYAEGLKTQFADVANVAGRMAGSVTAAKFLQRFAKKYPWAHLDIAGTAWKSGAAKGATGRPVALLLNYVLAQAGKQASQPAKAKRSRSAI